LFVTTWCAVAAQSGTAMAAGDAANGASIFQQCAACHSPEKGVNMVGPSLYGVIGRPAGSIADFDYSAAMHEAAQKGLTWTEDNVVAYLQNPHKFLEEFDKDSGVRNKMTFSLADMQQRQDVVAYLKTLAGEN
jgi:cytochrome c